MQLLDNCESHLWPWLYSAREHPGLHAFSALRPPILRLTFRALANVAHGFRFWVSVSIFILRSVSPLECSFLRLGPSEFYPSLRAQRTEVSPAPFSHSLLWESTLSPSAFLSRHFVFISNWALSIFEHVRLQNSRYFACVCMSFPPLSPLKVHGRACAMLAWRPPPSQNPPGRFTHRKH